MQPGTARPHLIGLLVRGLIFSLLLVSPFFLEYLASDGKSLRIFNDLDESTYLTLALRQARGQGLLFTYAEHDQGSDVQPPLPSEIASALAGNLALAFGLSPVELGLLLDFLCALAAYVLFSAAFLPLVRWRPAAEVAAVIVLFCPRLFAVDDYLHLPFFLPDRLINRPIAAYENLPVLRSVSTQLSYPLIAIVLLLLVRAFCRSRMSGRMYAAAGLVSGLLVYCYIFAYLAMLAFCGLAIFFAGFFLPGARQLGGRIRSTLSSVTLYFAAAGVTSAAGIRQTLAHGGFPVCPPGLLARYFYFSLELLIVAVLLLAAGALASERARKAAWLLAAAAAAAELILPNLQPLLDAPIQPYHFSRLYLQPIFGGFISLILLDSAQSLRSPRVRRLLAAAFLAAGITVSLFQHRLAIARFIVSADIAGNGAELIDFFKHVGGPKPVVAMQSVIGSFHPEPPPHNVREPWSMHLALLADVYLLEQEWVVVPGVPERESLEREFVIGLLFSGKPQLPIPCFDEAYNVPDNVFSSSWIFGQCNRISRCRAYPELKATFSPCEAVKKYRIDYIVWNNRDRQAQPEWYRRVTEPVFTTSGGKYQVLRFYKDRAIAEFCQMHVPEDPGLEEPELEGLEP